jgi:hypothetical protein
MSPHTVLICFLLSLPAPMAANETGWRKWKSAAGTEIEGRVIEWVPCPRVEESGMMMETSDGRKLKVTYQQLSLDDRVWLLQRYKDQLTGKDGEKEEKPAAMPADGKPVIKRNNEKMITPGKLFDPPPSENLDRRHIPGLGEYDDGSSRAVNLVTNHLFWLTKAGYTKYELGDDENRGWEKIHRDVRKRFRGGDSWEIEEVLELALEMLEREGKGIRRVQSWEVDFMDRSDFQEALFGPALVLVSAEAHRKDRKDAYEWTTVLPVMRWDKGSLVVSYDGEVTTLKLEDIKGEEGRGTTVKPGVTHHGYLLVHDPGDRSELAAKLTEEELELRLEVGRDDFCVIDMELVEIKK